jgi:hypothetical protein
MKIIEAINATPVFIKILTIKTGENASTEK